MKKYIVNIVLIINIGLAYYMGHNNVPVPNYVDVPAHDFYTTIFHALSMFFPETLGFPYTYVLHFMTINLLIGLCLLLFVVPFFVFGLIGRGKRE